MAVYLSQDWLDACREVLNASELVRVAGRGEFSGTFQHDVTGLPSCYSPECASFYSRFESGRCAEVGLGKLPSADFGFRGDYETWKSIHGGRTSIVTSVLTGRVRVRANPFKACCMALRYRRMFKMNRLLAQVPTEFPEGA